MNPQPQIRVSLVAVPDVAVSSLTGMYEVLNSFEMLATLENAIPSERIFAAEIVGPDPSLTMAASGLALNIHRRVEDVEGSDIVIVPAMLVKEGSWVQGRYPELIGWLRKMHARGALLCSACSGVLLLAETGLLDDRDATIHWSYEQTFRTNFPRVRLRLEEVLIVTGDRGEFIMSGASASWHDLILYLIARMVGPTAALAVSKFYLLQWHHEGQAPYVAFSPRTDHGDGAVLKVQEWLRRNFSTPNPVEEMEQLSGLAPRSFKRRFLKATGYTPIVYVQHLRVEEAKRRLERTAAAIDKISWAVGYEDPAFFRRLFKRITRIPPGAYRRKFRTPNVSDFHHGESRMKHRYQ